MIEGRNYLYDRFTNDIYPKTSKIVNKIKFMEDRLEKLIKNKYISIPFDENIISKKVFSDKPLEIIINITEKCNCECSYCIYGPSYPSTYKNNKNKTINIDIIQKSLSYFSRFLNLNEQKELYIGFYGGEPLLEWKLIEEITRFIQAYFREKLLRFSITTNLTNLTKPIAEFLSKNDFLLTISIDGPKEENDKFRKFKNGSGVFECVYKNIKFLISNYPEYFARNVRFSSVYCEAHDLNKINEFFLTDPFLDKSFFVSKVSEMDTLFYKKFIPKREDCHFLNQFYYFKKLFFKYKKGETIQKIMLSNYILSMFEFYYSLYFKKRNLDIYDIAWYLINDPLNVPLLPASCFPLGRKVYISSEGNYYICEKMAERILLGDVSSGINFKNIYEFIEGYLNDIVKHCLLCNYVQLCPACYANLYLYNQDKFGCENIKYVLEKQFLVDYISCFLNIDF
ncbi:MAG: radical SAM protein [Candidatus Saccharicenans sp.]|nr:radical SAM protein [Candidatus Saccharicenans sp.]